VPPPFLPAAQTGVKQHPEVVADLRLAQPERLGRVAPARFGAVVPGDPSTAAAAAAAPGRQRLQNTTRTARAPVADNGSQSDGAQHITAGSAGLFSSGKPASVMTTFLADAFGVARSTGCRAPEYAATDTTDADTAATSRAK